MWRTASVVASVSVVVCCGLSCAQKERSQEPIEKRTSALAVATPAGADVVVELNGGIGVVGGISVEFVEVTTAGNTAVAGPAALAFPGGSFVVQGPGGLNYYYQIGTTAVFTGPVQVCIHYEESAFEANQRMFYDDGSGFANLTSSLDTQANVVCGVAAALNNFPVDGGSGALGVATPVGTDVVVDLNGGVAILGGISLRFAQVSVAGRTALIGPEPGTFPAGTVAVEGVGGLHYYQIGTTAVYAGPIEVCIHYQEGPFEANQRMLYNDGSGVVNVTTSLDTQANVVCGMVTTVGVLVVDGGSDAIVTDGGTDGFDGDASPVVPDGGASTADAADAGSEAGAAGAAIGQPCATDGQCASSHCIDHVCCNNACGDGNPDDCQACSLAAGGPVDGTCSPLPATKVCYTRQNQCDSTEETLTCSGTGTSCPTPTPRPALSCTPLPTDVSPGVTVDLDGGAATVGGITLTFEGGLAGPGDISVEQCDISSPPPTGFKIVQTSTGPSCWNIDTSPDCAAMPGACPYKAPIQVCIHYDPAAVANEDFLELQHNAGSGYGPINTSLCKSNGCLANRICPSCCDSCSPKATICGTTDSLSPFALVQPEDTTGPVFSNVPGTIVAFATGTNGARVTYATPTAIDAVDGVRPVNCARPSGSQFPIGRTPVTCTASDNTGNVTPTTLTVWVQYQAPSDGTFFLKPIRSNGSSIFRIGKAVPVKFELTGASRSITNLVAKLVVTKISNAVHGTAEDVGDEDGEDTDFLFKYRPAKKLYGYRWKTRGETQGTYQLRADLGDGVVHAINVSLRTAK